jgi:hypothetical protein
MGELGIRELENEEIMKVVEDVENVGIIEAAQSRGQRTEVSEL